MQGTKNIGEANNMGVAIGVVCGSPTDSTSLYRGWGPFGALRKWASDIELLELESISWFSLKRVDVLFLQRPFKPEHVQMAKTVVLNKKPLWLDYDDDLTCVPVSNPAYRLYGNAGVQEAIKQMLNMASIITVSTEALKKKYATLTPRPIVVIPNAFDDHLLPMRENTLENVGGQVFWRGSPTHMDDLYDVKEQFEEIFNAVTGWSFVFLGFCPGFMIDIIEKSGNKLEHEPACDPMVYFYKLKTSKPRIMLVPLKDCEFNRSKSNCAWLETAWAGGITVAPNWSEWKMPGVINYDSAKDFGKVVLDAMKLTDDQVIEKSNNSWKHVMSNYRLSIVNRKRKEVIQGLI